MFISPAWAQAATEATTAADAAAPVESGGIMGLLGPIAPIVVIFFIFYVMVIRPQNKRMVEHRRSIDDLQKGDKVVTGGGLLATVRKVVGEEEIELEIAPGIIVTAVRGTLMSIRDSNAIRAAKQGNVVQK